MKKCDCILDLVIVTLLAVSTASAEPLGTFSFQTVQAGSMLPVNGVNKGDAPPFRIVNSAPAAIKSSGQRKEVASISLADLKDRHWNTSLSYTLGGKKVVISGTFDRQKNAFLSVFVAGDKTPRFFDLKALLENPATAAIGTANYSIYLAANPVKPLKSQIILENKANDEDLVSVQVGKLLSAVQESGASVTLFTRNFRLFYMSDVKKGASGIEVDPGSSTFALIPTETTDRDIFLIPGEEIPADRINIYHFYDNEPVGLRIDGGSLKIYENP